MVCVLQMDSKCLQSATDDGQWLTVVVVVVLQAKSTQALLLSSMVQLLGSPIFFFLWSGNNQILSPIKGLLFLVCTKVYLRLSVVMFKG